MNRGGYWSRVLERRLPRRRALAVTGGAAAAAGLLAACGGDDGGGDKSGLVTQAVDTTRQAKRGGIMKDRTSSDVPSLSVSTGGSPPHNAVGPMVYSSLLQYKPGYLKPSEQEVIGDIVESWEWSPDGLSIVWKLRQGVKFHNKPPVNGRGLDIDDVLLTWDRFTRQGSARSGVVNAINPQAPVLSLTATDSKTLVLKLKEPIVYALDLFTANTASSGLAIAPKEADTTWDDRADMIGTGPFILTNYTPSVGFTLGRNPEFWDKDDALVDRIDLPIIAEYAAALAQFKAGNIYSFGSSRQVNSEDILPVKREQPRLLIYESDLQDSSEAKPMSFGWLPEGKTPFLDERVRQAISMSWDRDLYLDTFHDVSRFGAEGMQVGIRWNSHLTATYEGWWLDPKGKDFGPNAKYFQHNLPEAKKLLAAAGYPNGFETTSNYVTGPELPTAKHAAVIDAFISELGIRSTVKAIDYRKEYQPLYRDGRGQYEGWAYTSGGSGVANAVSILAMRFWAKGGHPSFYGFSTSGQNDISGDPQVDALIEKVRVERDTEKRRALVFDLQRYLAKAMYVLNSPGGATGFTMAWPCIGNFRVYRRARLNYRLWVDETKPPFKSG